MIKIEYVKGKDFLSFEDLAYEFESRPLALNGENLDEDDQKSNGSGKSSFLTLVEWLILRSNSRKQVDKKLIRRGCKQASGELQFFCPTRNERFRIERVQKLSGSSLELYKNDEPLQFSKVADGDDMILNWLGYTKDFMYKYVFLNNERYKSFFHLSEKERISLLSSLTDTEHLSKVDEVVKEEVKELNDSLTRIDLDIASKKGQIDVISADLKKLKDGFGSVSASEQKEVLNDRLKAKIEQGVTLKGQVDEAKTEIKKLEAVLAGHIGDMKKLIEGQSNYDIVKTKLDELKAARVSEETVVSKNNNILNGAIDCPKCKHTFSLSYDGSLDDLRKAQERSKLIIAELEAKIKRGDAKLDELQRVRRDIYAIETKVNHTESQISMIQSQIKSKESFMASLRNEALAIKKEISEVKPIDNSDMIDAKSFDLEKICHDIGESEKKRGILVGEIESREEWKINLKSFNMSIINSVLEDVQDRCNSVLEGMRSDLRLKINGFSVDAKGNVKEKITPMVIRDMNEENFFYYSGGERAKVLYATITAIKELLDADNPWGGLDFLSVDEVFEGLEELGFKYLMKSIKDDDRTMFIVTHSLSDYLDDKSLTVIKEKGIGRIKV